MATSCSPPNSLTKGPPDAIPKAGEIGAALLTGGFDRPYVFGLTTALASKGVRQDVIGSDEVDCAEMHAVPKLTFLNLFGNRGEASLAAKISRVLIYYARLVRYAAGDSPKVFHILWNNKFQLFDRTLLMLYYKVLGKKIAFTAHNVNAGKRDGNDSLVNRLTLRVQYRLADHIFVHTEQMKRELQRDFGVRESAITVIPFGINNSVPHTGLTPVSAKQRLGITPSEKTILFFGAIGPYKGLEYLVDAFLILAAAYPEYRLIIAGLPKEGTEEYLDAIHGKIEASAAGPQIIRRIHYIPDEETELYFKAADVLALPYTHIFQSGVLFLAYSFGLPVVAADVGSIREDIVEGETGFLCRPCDSADLAAQIRVYFESDLFRTLDNRRREIIAYANERHSWDVVGTITHNVYSELLAREL